MTELSKEERDVFERVWRECCYPAVDVGDVVAHDQARIIFELGIQTERNKQRMGIKLMKKEDGFWLSFPTKDSSGVVVNLEQLFPFGVRRNVILRWAEEQIASTEKGESL